MLTSNIFLQHANIQKPMSVLLSTKTIIAKQDKAKIKWKQSKILPW